MRVRRAVHPFFSVSDLLREHGRTVIFFFVVVVVLSVLSFNVDRIVRVLGGWASSSAFTQAEQDILEREAYLLRQSQELAANTDILSAVESRDDFRLLAVGTKESRRRSVEGVVITDSEGFVLSRTRVPTKNADNVFLTTLWGRYLAAGNEISTLSSGVGNVTLSIVAGAPLYRDTEYIGSVIRTIF